MLVPIYGAPQWEGGKSAKSVAGKGLIDLQRGGMTLARKVVSLWEGGSNQSYNRPSLVTEKEGNAIKQRQVHFL